MVTVYEVAGQGYGWRPPNSYAFAASGVNREALPVTT